MSNCVFINNTANYAGAICWNGANGIIYDSSFINNSAIVGSGGSILWRGNYGSLINSTFDNNLAKTYGGSIWWGGICGTVSSCKFTNNNANQGGSIIWDIAGVNATIIDSNFINNSANDAGAIFCGAASSTITGCNFINNKAISNAGAIYFTSKAINNIINDSNFTGNNAKHGGAICCYGANSNIFNCNFKYNNAIQGDNVYWEWTAEEFLNKYGQIHDYDYVYIRNGVGTPSHTIVLNKKGITISGQSTNVIFDAKGSNLHFEVTGDNVLIEKITFRNFNFTNHYGGAIHWIGKFGILKNCNFINNTANWGGAVHWNGGSGAITNSIFTNNTAKDSGGAVRWGGPDGILTSCTFTGNTAKFYGGGVAWGSNVANGYLTNSTFNDNQATAGAGVHWWGPNGTLTSSTFTSNHAADGAGVQWWGPNGTLTSSAFNLNYAGNGGGIYWSSPNGTLTSSTFTSNSAGANGGGIYWSGANNSLRTSTFTANSAVCGGAIYWLVAGFMNDCNFANKWLKSNGIYASSNLTIKDGTGIVDIVTNNTISGTSIAVLNNETYYYPPNSNINFHVKIIGNNE